jgi:WD40 repeat protein/tRNA A-37 threonylcarbamoyl transferase component Bud32
MSEPLPGEQERLPPLSDAIDTACDRFEAAWDAALTGATRPRIEEYLGQVPEAERARLLLELILLDMFYRGKAGERPAADDYLGRFPFLSRSRLHRHIHRERHTIPAPAAEPGAEAKMPGVAVPGYELLGVLGEGGMGVVYKARQVALNRLVALKMILHAEHAGADLRERFRIEAEALARLQHPNIVQIHEVGEHNGLPYFALEFCEGGSLDDQLDGTPWPPAKAAALVQTLARAVHAAHRANVIHRDLKPANVLLTAEGQPKITDFGLAKKLDEQGKTQTGAVMGTPSYMAPEQAGGKPREIGPAADVYALGAILYELLVGRPPFKAATPLDTMLQVLSEEPVAVRRLQPKVPKDLETVCHKCLEKEPKKRYVSAEMLAEDLRRFGAGESVTARPVGAVGRAVKWVRRKPAVAGLLATVLLAVAAGFAGVLWAYGRAVREAEEARRQEYFAQIGRTDAELMANDFAGAAGVLERIGPEFRNWEYGYLRRRIEGTPHTLRGHTKGVPSVAYSPDGTRLASASADGAVKLWDARSGAEIATLRGHTGEVWSVAYSPDGARLASASADGAVKLWDARSGAEIATLRGHTNGVLSVVYSRDGTRLASASADKTVKVWDATSGAQIATLRGHTSWVTAVVYSRDGTRLASASYDQTVKLWDARSGAEVATLRGHTYLVLSVAYSPDGTRLASASRDNTVKVWDARSGAEIATLRGHTSWVTAVVYSRDGTRLASASYDQTVKLWDARSGAEVATLRGHTNAVLAVAYSPDGTRLASASHDNTVKLWDARSGAQIATLRGHTANVLAVAYSPDGTRLASASGDPYQAGKPGEVKLWDARSGAELATLRGHTGPATAVAYSPDGTRLASASADKTIKVWDARSGAQIATLRGHTGWVSSVSYSPDGTRLASASSDLTVKVWGAHSGAELATLRGHTYPVKAVAYSPDGTRLARASADTTVKVWGAHSSAELATLRGHTNFVNSVAYSPDGTRLASASEDQTVKLWDARSGADIATLRGHTGAVTSVCYSPDGTRIASGSGDRPVKLWDARSGTEVLTLRGHNAAVTAVSFSPDGTRQASAATDGTVKLWDARNGPPSTNYDPWAEDFDRWRALAPAWHAEDAAAAEKVGNSFAAAFHRRQLAQLVRAAAVVPEAGVPAAELVAQARLCAEAEPESWRARELLGAALYRAGKPEDAVRELDEALRRHGSGGSTWAKLFLALAHQRLGHAEQAQQFRHQAQASSWEDPAIHRQLSSELDAPQLPVGK